ncbi:hybrid sensor histidine kinase/response regulator [Planctomyces sp. SH-PL62]|uniref:hybrid sensor histidine kinase/response regulator n=1 Tax=Planctomyces sp. SH-PL62 TaxID=1636152 RepID=UPI00078D51AE|nr:hybrid sensor histidine kinase/response regulator [Planctomyces sp. SH-PL62]AMV40632.1 Sensor histidine kinase TodS [Planctomyces sp. SH-PL62]
MVTTQERHVPAATGTADPTRNRRRPVVLVVDDEPEVLRSIHDLLRIDYQIVTRGSGVEALEYLRTAPDVSAILTDQRMPGMTGVELLREAADVRPETTRLLFTAFADLSTVVDAINRGHVFRYIAKPWDPDELQALIRQAVERHDLIAEKSRLMIELQEANARLVEADRLKGAFLEVASHELNTPVTVIKGLSDLWKMSQAAAAAPAEVDWVDRIRAAADRLARTVERMLKLIDTKAFSQGLATEPVDLEPLIRGAIDVVTPYLEKRGQTIEVAIQPGLAPVHCDRDKIHDVLINLLINAVKFTPDGMTIAVEAADQEDGEREGDADAPRFVRVAVRDQGAGLDPENRRFLFEPFFTGFDTLHHSSGEYQFGKRGIGLGLCLVKTFVELHGGRVEASTPADGLGGSVFAFVLPHRPAPTPVPPLGQVAPFEPD